MKRLQVLLTLLCGVICTACNFPYSGKAEAAVPTVVPSFTMSVSPVTTGITVAPVTAVATLPTLVPSPTDTPLNQPLPTTFVEPAGCERPPDDYSRLVINGSKLNYRTFWMLKHAKGLYKGTIDFTGLGITQGSYNPGGVVASFGTHDGGGAVDISVSNPKNGKVNRAELPDAIRVLRISGFAAWVREPNELYNGSLLHIHAIAIGDAELSSAAREQLTGTFGYFLGYNGLPQKDGPPIADRHGGPVLCQWMLDMGYRDMRP